MTKVLLIDSDYSFIQSFVSKLSGVLSEWEFDILDTNVNDDQLWIDANNKFLSTSYDFIIVGEKLGKTSGIFYLQKWRMHEDPIKKSFYGFVFLSASSKLESSSHFQNLLTELGNIQVASKPINALPFSSVILSASKLQKEGREMARVEKDLLNLVLNKEKAVDEVIVHIQQSGSKYKEYSHWIMLNFLEANELYEDAISYMINAPHTIASHPKLLNQKGRILMKMGKRAEAMAIFQALDKMTRANLERISMELNILLGEDNIVKIKEKMTSLMKMTPSDNEIHLRNISELVSKGFKEEAYTLGVKHYGVSDLYTQMNNSAALNILNANTADIDESKMLSVIDDSIKRYDNALSLSPPKDIIIKILYNKVLALYRRLKITKSKEDAEKGETFALSMIAIDPSNTKAINILNVFQNFLDPSRKKKYTSSVEKDAKERIKDNKNDTLNSLPSSLGEEEIEFTIENGDNDLDLLALLEQEEKVTVSPIKEIKEIY